MAPLTRTLLTASALVVLAACAKKAPEELPPAPVETARPSDATPAAATPAGPVKGSQEDFLASVAADKIYFDTDKYDVDAADQDVLRSQAQWLAANAGVKVTVEGHADERGTIEYNLALSDRRARVAYDYLVSIGIAPSRIKAVAYGKEIPVCTESNEDCWQRNRRAHFAITGKLAR